jgi:cold shock CspA family protein
MQVPLEVYFHNTAKSDTVEAAVRERARKLEKYADKIISCRVTIAAPHKHHHQGKLFRVTIDLHVPGDHIVVNRDPSEHHAHEDVTVAIRDAFDAARRRLQDHTRVERGKVKTHEGQPHGRIVELVPEQDFGRIETADGREVYFHRNSVLNADFATLETGMRVSFDEERGDQGPQASTVHVLS